MEERLEKFITKQEHSYQNALSEITAGKKTSHWMWYIFPQLAGLGYSEMAKHFAIADIGEAQAYLNHPILGQRLIEISTALLQQKSNNATAIFGSPDDLKLRSCMTLFSIVKNADPIFEQVLEKFFDGEKDPLTLALTRWPSN